MYRFSLILFLSLFFLGSLHAQENLNVLDRWIEYSDAPNALYHHLLGEAQALLDERRQGVSELDTEAEWQARQQEIRTALQAAVGPFPERTPLNARVTGVIEQEGYQIEKLVFESVPGYFVTAAVYVPEGRTAPGPAVVYCSGHTTEGFRSPVYQNVAANLARKGFLVLAFDPVGQGERMLYWDEATGESWIGGPTKEHSYPGAQAFVAGTSAVKYFIWDGIRAVDYLLTRPDVDPARIGITGRSGGGTQTAYIAAFDERIYASAPEAFITSLDRLLTSIGPQDAEQNLDRMIAHGLDHADVLTVRAPKPTLVISTTRDFFSIQGARETFAEVQRVYEAFGRPKQLQMVEDDTTHASTLKNREALYRFFQTTLNQPGSVEEEPVTILTPEELQVTETGQVVTALDSRGLFEVIQDEIQPPGSTEGVVEAARRLSGYIEPDGMPDPVFRGRYSRDGYVVEQYFITGASDYPVPYLLMRPSEPGPHPALVYLHPDGKAAEAAPGGEIEAFVREGYTVLAPDLLGFGEVGTGDFEGDAYEFKVGTGAYNLWFLAMLSGQSLVGIRAADVNRLVRVLVDEGHEVTVLGKGKLAPVALHAAAFESSVQQVMLVDEPTSYRQIATEQRYDPTLIHGTVPGALTAYDLPDLIEALGDRVVRRYR